MSLMTGVGISNGESSKNRTPKESPCRISQRCPNKTTPGCNSNVLRIQSPTGTPQVRAIGMFEARMMMYVRYPCYSKRNLYLTQTYFIDAYKRHRYVAIPIWTLWLQWRDCICSITESEESIISNTNKWIYIHHNCIHLNQNCVLFHYPYYLFFNIARFATNFVDITLLNQCTFLNQCFHEYLL